MRGTLGTMSIHLKRESFLAIAAVGWADGRMSREEAAGLVRAAKECGLEGDDLSVVEKAAKEGGATLDGYDPSALSGWERALTYAIASWLARIDGVVDPSERASLKQLGSALDLPADKLGFAASAAFDVSCLPGGHRPEKYDFAALEKQLRIKLPSLVD